MTEAATVPEKATQAAEAHGRDWTWVEASIWTERMVAALGNGVKGGCWYSLMDKVYRPATLRAAWQRVQANRGAAGVDGQSIAAFGSRAEDYLQELEQSLKSGNYHPQAVRRVEIPKSDGKTRPLGIPAVKDRIVQAAVKLVIEPIFEAQFLPVSYGFRPGRGCKDALREVDAGLKEGHCFVVDADLKSYFDTIPHEPLMQRLRERVSDGPLLELLARYLRQDVMQGLESWTPTAGTPQGAVLSPLLANLYLHGLDVRMVEKGYRFVRYADDFVVLCRTQAEALAALTEVRDWVEKNGLNLHPDKTRVGDCRIPGQGFDFLGYRFEAGQRHVRRKSRNTLRDKVREKTGRSRGDSLACIIADLNPMLKGWFNYFRHAHPMTFPSLDGFIQRRLRAILRTHDRRPGRGRCRADHQRWTKAFFAAQGLFTLTTAFALASQSR